MSHVDGIVLCVAKNIFIFEGVATNHKSKIHILVVCTWPLLFYSYPNTVFYHFVCAYPVLVISSYSFKTKYDLRHT